MISKRLRDRDAIVTEEGLIFRVYGYSHPPSAYVCDVEYAPASVFRSEDPKAPRGKEKHRYFKFFSDQGLRFVQRNYPQYTVWFAPLQTRLVGTSEDQIREVRKPAQAFLSLVEKEPRDILLRALQRLANLFLEGESGLSEADFGVFGSLLHSFYHPQLSDLDLVVYGKEELRRLRELLESLYSEKASPLRNEFENDEALKSKHWEFVNYSPKEFVWHQRRKLIYATFHDKSHGKIKTEFEPVKQWEEIRNEYDEKTRILKQGWIKAIARVTDDSEAPFMPSIYKVELVKILNDKKVDDVRRIVSFMEEFRMQAEKNEEVYVEGNLEQVVTSTHTFHQITLTYGPRYYEQVLKVPQSR